MSTIDRRSLLKSGLFSGLSVGLTGLVARPALAGGLLDRGAANEKGGYGKLQPTPSENTGEKILALPEGFKYTVFGRVDEKLTDGNATPAAHDGMAAFAYRGKIRLIRNHEVRNDPGPGKAIAKNGASYDETAGGGTTTLTIDPKTREVVESFVSLSGTLVNCAGGPTPWGSWISCEETCAGSGQSQVYHKDKEQGGGYAKEHGYNFEVPVTVDGPANPVPLKAMGRFVHEALAVDPKTGIIYQTEDAGKAGFYRFLPEVPAKLAEGGRLQMAKVKGQANVDTRKGQRQGQTYAIEWVDIKEPDPASAFTNPSAVYEQGLAEGGMTFGRLEGAWYADGSIFINSTDGGDKNKGQIWRYRPRGEKEGELTLLFESPGAEVLDMPDNMCVSPRGGLVICEDGDGTNYVRGLTQKGTIFEFAVNLLNSSEFTGATFSPDGQTLFFNIQNPGQTFAVWGPWAKGSL